VLETRPLLCPLAAGVPMLMTAICGPFAVNSMPPPLQARIAETSPTRNPCHTPATAWRMSGCLPPVDCERAGHKARENKWEQTPDAVCVFQAAVRGAPTVATVPQLR
jgi:hypothetical protein